jgi:hypothetical protein
MWRLTAARASYPQPEFSLGYKNLRYLLLKAKRVAVTNVEFLAVRRVAKAA